MSTIERMFGFEAQFVRLGPCSFSPEGVMDLQRWKSDSVEVGV